MHPFRYPALIHPAAARIVLRSVLWQFARLLGLGLRCMELTALIRAARDGGGAQANELFAQVYADLRHIAAAQLRGSAGLGTTSLVHEAYFRLAKPESLDVADRHHFFAVAAVAMRQIVINQLRAQQTVKRGAGAVCDTLGAADRQAVGVDSTPLLALDAALTALALAQPRLAQLVELRYFGGLTLEEAGAAMDLSATTAKRDWRKARAYLHAAMDHAP
jgi:RNA polymerase sigma factor (TIGR02999 family)